MRNVQLCLEINPKKIRTGTTVTGYSMWIASDGHASTQVSHSTHMSLSTHAFSLSIDIASAGHSLTHVSHPVHFSLSTTAGKFFTPQQWLLTGKRQRRSGSQRTFPCRPSLFRSLRRLPMRDIHVHRSRSRYILRCQRLQPTHSLHRIC